MRIKVEDYEIDDIMDEQPTFVKTRKKNNDPFKRIDRKRTKTSKRTKREDLDLY